MIGANVVLTCQRIGCEETVIIEILPPPTERVAELMNEEAPGWGWDVAGVDTALHCPDHRP